MKSVGRGESPNFSISERRSRKARQTNVSVKRKGGKCGLPFPLWAVGWIRGKKGLPVTRTKRITQLTFYGKLITKVFHNPPRLQPASIRLSGMSGKILTLNAMDPFIAANIQKKPTAKARYRAAAFGAPVLTWRATPTS